MSKKLDQPNFNFWSAIIGVTGVIIGAALGYFGTQASAQAQIETAKINIYGPIYTTQTAEAKQISTTHIVTPNVYADLLVESIPQEVFSFQGKDEQNEGIASFRMLYGIEKLPIYVLLYDLPTDQNQFGWAGLAFKFDQEINISEYKSLDFTIQFDAINENIDLVLVDRENKKQSIRISSKGEDPTNETLPLNNFTEINLNALKEVNLYTQTDASSGYHTVAISNIRFVK